MDRRDFLQTTVALSAAIAAPARSYARILGAGAAIRVGVVGLHGRGKDHVAGFGDRVVAVCDCDQSVLDAAFPDKPFRRYRDYRELLDDSEIDVVSIATPNHTHALIAISAVLAGKDVYVEKPVSHNVWEGRQIVNAARKHRRLVQCGTQSRSSPSLKQAFEFAQNGQLGKVKFAVGTCYKPRKSIGKLDAPLKIPDSVDYDLWCGPAEKVDLYRPQLHYDWHWDFNTGNGDMGNQGIHQMDIARWFLGKNGLSQSIWSLGGRLGYEDAGNTPNSQTVLHDFGDTFLIFETRGLPSSKEFHDPKLWDRNMDKYRGATVGVVVQYENGYLVIPNYTSAKAFDHDGKELGAWQGEGDHYANLISAIEAGDASMLNGNIEQGHLSSALCHTGAVSHLLGRSAMPAELSGLQSDRPEFLDSIQRLTQHLAANGVDLEKTPLTIGRQLKMDPAAELFLDDAEANTRLTREYRQPFAIPAV